MDEKKSTETIFLAALSSLTPTQLSHLTTSISSLFHRNHCRLSSLLSSPTLFYLTLLHLHSLSLRQKSLLIARHLFSALSHLSPFIPSKTSPTLYDPVVVNFRNLDSVLLLLLLCELHHNDPQTLKMSPCKWRTSLSNYVSHTMLTMSGVKSSKSEVLIEYIELVTKCQRFVGMMGRHGGEEEGKEVVASVAAVAALLSVEVSGGGKECVICKEEMSEGRDVCELPCDHLFHWLCILPWLMKRNTCPCCRYRLPTDDVFAEIERLWEALVRMGCN